MKRAVYTAGLLLAALAYLLSCAVWPVIGFIGFAGSIGYVCWMVAGGYLDSKA